MPISMQWALWLQWPKTKFRRWTLWQMMLKNRRLKDSIRKPMELVDVWPTDLIEPDGFDENHWLDISNIGFFFFKWSDPFWFKIPRFSNTLEKLPSVTSGQSNMMEILKRCSNISTKIFLSNKYFVLS
jgi:hypothetical protein